MLLKNCINNTTKKTDLRDDRRQRTSNDHLSTLAVIHWLSYRQTTETRSKLCVLSEKERSFDVYRQYLYIIWRGNLLFVCYLCWVIICNRTYFICICWWNKTKLTSLKVPGWYLWVGQYRTEQYSLVYIK